MIEIFERLTGWVDRQLGISPEVLLRLLGTIAVIFAYLVVVRVGRRIAGKTVEDAASRYQIGKATRYVSGFIAFGLLVKIWVQGVAGLATYFGLLSAGLALALQDAIANLAGWLFVVARRPFTVGDRIQIGAHAGDVVDIRLFQFTLLEIGNWVDGDQSTGRVIHVPNGWVFKNPVMNYDKGFRYVWHEIAVTVSFESNWRHAKAVLTKAVNDHAEHLTVDAQEQIERATERYHLRFSKLTPVVWTSVVESGVKLTLRYLCKPRDRRSSSNEMWEAILDEFGRLPDIEFAYPTIRRFDNAVEGKPEARSSLLPDAETILSGAARAKTERA